MLQLFKLLPSSNFLVSRSSKATGWLKAGGCSRAFADTPHTDLTTSKQLIQGTENESKVRVRRAKSSDVPRVLRFVREHSRVAWPSLVSAPVAPKAASQLVLSDYVARALAQGHSMVAEQVASRRGWLTLRGLALGSAVCPWDAQILEKWARCMRDQRSRRLINFTAHCLRGPALHEKYRVHNILQVILIISPESQNCQEIVQMLTKSAIQRGREVGFPLMRFDVTSEPVAKALAELNLKREWHLSYDVLPAADVITDDNINKTAPLNQPDKTSKSIAKTESMESVNLAGKGHFIAVYSASTTADPQITASASGAAGENAQKRNG